LVCGNITPISASIFTWPSPLWEVCTCACICLCVSAYVCVCVSECVPFPCLLFLIRILITQKIQSDLSSTPLTSLHLQNLSTKNVMLTGPGC
jgi:hypothetical protein